MRPIAAVFALLCPLALLYAQDAKPKDVREIAKGGSGAIPKLEEFLKYPARDVRLEAVKQLTQIGTQRSLDPLVAATRDADPEVQSAAANGLVNFYAPGYVQTGVGGALKRIGSGIKGIFADPEEQAIEPYVVVRPEVIAALGKLATGGGGMEARATGARDVGVLRGKAAVPDLIEAVHSKDTDVIYEALIALQKIRDESAGPRVEFRLRDLDAKVQTAAIETVGLLRDHDALPTLVDILKRTGDIKIRRTTLTSIAMVPDETSRPLYAQYLRDKDEKLRSAAAEGYGRLAKPEDLSMVAQAWQEEAKQAPRLALAFAQVMLGKRELGEMAPLQALVDGLNSAAYGGVAFAYLVELTRQEPVRAAIYPALRAGTKDEKIGLARVLGRTGDKASIPELLTLSNDKDAEVAQEGLRSVRALQSKL